MQNIRPWLWFETQAEEAANFYVSTFKNSRIVEIARYGPEGPGPEDSVMLVRFTIDGTDAMAINMFDNEHRGVATMYANVAGGQDEVDRIWGKACGRRPAHRVRLGRRSIRHLVERRTRRVRSDDPRPRSAKAEPRDASYDDDGEVGYCRASARLRRRVAPTPRSTPSPDRIFRP